MKGRKKFIQTIIWYDMMMMILSICKRERNSNYLLLEYCTVTNYCYGEKYCKIFGWWWWWVIMSAKQIIFTDDDKIMIPSVLYGYIYYISIYIYLIKKTMILFFLLLFVSSSLFLHQTHKYIFHQDGIQHHPVKIYT